MNQEGYPEKSKPMKKRSLRTYLSVLLVAFSFASYIYINTVSVEELTKPQCNKQLMATPDDDQDDNATELPEVQLVKELIEKGRRLLPATRL